MNHLVAQNRYFQAGHVDARIDSVSKTNREGDLKEHKFPSGVGQSMNEQRNDQAHSKYAKSSEHV